jgi:hypothetical protein
MEDVRLFCRRLCFCVWPPELIIRRARQQLPVHVDMKSCCLECFISVNVSMFLFT